MSWCRSFLAATALAAASGGGFDARAAEWTWGGSASGRVEQIGNPSLATPPAAASRSTLGVDLDLAARSEEWDAAASANYASNSSSLQSLAQDSYGAALALKLRYARDILGLNASLRRESTLTSELATTGVSIAQAQRETRSLAPSWQRTLSERLSLALDANLQSVAYDRRGGSLTDFTSASASAGLVYQLSPRAEARFTAGASRFRTEPFTSDSDTTNFSVSLQYLPNDRWTLNGSWGPSRTRTRVAGQARICPVAAVFCDAGLVPFEITPTEERRVSSGDTWSLSANWAASPSTSMLLQASRAVVPGGGGTLSQSEAMSASLNHRINERLSAVADIGETRTGTLQQGAAAGIASRRAGASINWQLEERVSLDAGLRWNQSRLPGGASPDSTTLFVALRYSLSRRVLR